jgi:phospho-N-acetylmuramoyl-pentapeptide-transferase
MHMIIACAGIGFIVTFVISAPCCRGSGNWWCGSSRNSRDVQGEKAGTPTIGGIAFCVGTTVANLATGINPVLLLSMWLFCLIGLWDDVKKTHTLNGDGLSPRTKLLSQLFVSVLVVSTLAVSGNLHTTMFGHNMGSVVRTVRHPVPDVLCQCVNITTAWTALQAWSPSSR